MKQREIIRHAHHGKPRPTYLAERRIFWCGHAPSAGLDFCRVRLTERLALKIRFEHAWWQRHRMQSRRQAYPWMWQHEPTPSASL